MPSNFLSGLLTALAFFPISHSLKILVGNDDGFGAANIRAFYDSLKASGHDVILVAPVSDQSGQGGRSSFSTSSTLQTASEFNLIPAGAPSIGSDINDNHI